MSNCCEMCSDDWCCICEGSTSECPPFRQERPREEVCGTCSVCKAFVDMPEDYQQQAKAFLNDFHAHYRMSLLRTIARHLNDIVRDEYAAMETVPTKVWDIGWYWDPKTHRGRRVTTQRSELL